MMITATSQTTANIGTATQASAWPVSRGRYCWMLPRNPGTSTIVAKCTNLNTKIDKARMMVFRRVQEGKI